MSRIGSIIGRRGSFNPYKLYDFDIVVISGHERNYPKMKSSCVFECDTWAFYVQRMTARRSHASPISLAQSSLIFRTMLSAGRVPLSIMIELVARISSD